MAADCPANPPTCLHQLYLCGLGSSAVSSHVVPALALSGHLRREVGHPDPTGQLIGPPVLSRLAYGAGDR